MTGSPFSSDTSDQDRHRKLRWVLIVAASYVFALFAAFAAIGMAVEAGVNYFRERWPATAARIERCDVKPYQSSTGRRLARSAYYIECAVSYEAEHARITTATIRSRRIASPERAWPDTTAQILEMRAWVEQRPAGSLLPVHYDPADSGHVVLTTTEMPMAGPQIHDKVTLALFLAAVWGLLTLIGHLLRPAPKP